MTTANQVPITSTSTAAPTIAPVITIQFSEFTLKDSITSPILVKSIVIS
jgi:hypothetical protein